MSRSIHKTKKGVFGGKSKEEIRRMAEEGDPDAEELAKKKSYKRNKMQKRKASKSDKHTRAELDCSEEVWSQVKKSLEKDGYKWRTITGISKETRLPHEQIWYCLALHENEVIKSSLPSKSGASLYTTRVHYRKNSSFWGRLESSILNRVVS